MKTKKTTKAKQVPTEFDRLMKRAADLLVEAMELKNANSIGLAVRYGGQIVADLYFSEREQEGALAADGTFKLERKP